MPLTLVLEAGPSEVSVRLHGPDGELDQVESVTYWLQSLVPQHPLRHIRERSSGFRLAATGKHVLGVQARVYRRDGSEEVLEQ